MGKEKNPKHEFRVFLSHSAQDHAYVSKLKQLLDVYPDVKTFCTDSLPAGEPWQVRVKDELSKADIVLVFVSPSSISSKWVLTEVGAAWAMNRPIVAVAMNKGVRKRTPFPVAEWKVLTDRDLDEPKKLDSFFRNLEEVASKH